MINKNNSKQNYTVKKSNKNNKIWINKIENNK